MPRPHWALAVMMLGIVPPAWGQDAQGSFFHRPPPATAAPPPPAADPVPPAAEASPLPVPQSAPSPPAPPPIVRVAPSELTPAVPKQPETKPVVDGCGSSPGAVLQFLRVFFANGSGSPRIVLGYQEQIYADQVIYYGKATPRVAVLKEKEAYLNRWPLRTYTMRGNGEIRCDPATGTYEFAGVVDWAASSPAISNGAVKSGAAIVKLGISASSINSFRIIRESSEVTERYPDQNKQDSGALLSR